MIRVLLIRHGETAWNAEHRLQGHSDIPLAASGVAQAKATGGFVRAQQPGQGYVSSLVRTQQTFAQFGLGIAPQVWPELAEQNLGEWEGRYAAEVRAETPEQFAAWRAGTYTPASGEPHDQLVQRMRTSFYRIVRGTAETEATASPDLSFPVRTAVVVSHGAALRVLLEGLGLLDREQFIPLTPAAVSVIDIPLHSGAVSSSLPKGGLDDGADDATERDLIRALTDEQIQQRSRLRLINLSPEMLTEVALNS